MSGDDTKDVNLDCKYCKAEVQHRGLTTEASIKVLREWLLEHWKCRDERPVRVTLQGEK